MKKQLPNRKRLRLRNYNYSWEGSYFITICSKDRECIFGRVIKDYIDNDNILAVEKKIAVDAHVELSVTGEIVRKYIETGHTAYRNMFVETYVIMPNHLHLLLYVKGNKAFSNCSNSAVPNFVSALKHLINNECGKNIFQRSYNDHIIRNDKEFDKIYDYIEYNPQCWEKDCFYEKMVW